MLISIAYILIFGTFFAKICDFLKLPDLIGYIFCGFLLNQTNLLHPDIRLITSDLRLIALIIILYRASLSLDLKKLKSLSKTVILLSFFPALCEILALVFFSTLIFDVPLKTALLIGATVAAVSPAIVVPRMLKIKDTNPKVSNILLASVSLDDIFVIILFYSFLNGDFSSLYNIPLSFILGIILGLILAFSLIFVLKRTVLRANVTLGILLAFAFTLLHFEKSLPFSALISILTIGIVFRKKMSYLSNSLSRKFDDLWSVFAILLFVLVGFELNFTTITNYGFLPIILVLLGLVFRIIGTYLSLSGSDLSKNEKLFCIISFLPKATVQASLCAIPLSLGLPYGELILTISVISILITAPLGAILLDRFTLLPKD